MNDLTPFLQKIAGFSPLDVLLADVAIRIQLTPTDYLTAVRHYEVMGEWIDRPESPLSRLVDEFYPQGGFSTGSTIASHDDNSDYDLDAMASINWPRSIDPEHALATLNSAIAGEVGSRYHDKAERKTRCTQIQYGSMHLDVTPSVLLTEYQPKTSIIFHSKPSDPRVAKESLLANPSGLATWFNGRTRVDEAFGRYFEGRSLEYNRTKLTNLKADTSPVPMQLPIYRKSPQVICLQLIKRWRNIAYERRHKGLRLPPSVLLTYYVGLNTGREQSLADELIYQLEKIITTLAQASSMARLVHEVNPTCDGDVLTDRWPGKFNEQTIFTQELRDFVLDLKRLKSGLPLAEMSKLLEKLFGEKPARDAVDSFSQRHVQDNNDNKGFYIPGKGAVPALGSLATPSLARAIPKSTPYGD